MKNTATLLILDCFSMYVSNIVSLGSCLLLWFIRNTKVHTLRRGQKSFCNNRMLVMSLTFHFHMIELESQVFPFYRCNFLLKFLCARLTAVQPLFIVEKGPCLNIHNHYLMRENSF